LGSPSFRLGGFCKKLLIFAIVTFCSTTLPNCRMTLTLLATRLVEEGEQRRYEEGRSEEEQRQIGH
jgi:hypothetical protein